MSSASVRSIDSANLNDDLRAELVVLASSSGPHGLVRDSIDDARGLGRRQRPSQLQRGLVPGALATPARTASLGPWSTPRELDSASVAGGVAGGVPDAELSPLGPNSIFKLTVASDLARQQHGRAPRSHVSLSGGATAVSGLVAPSVLAIPQIQLLPLPRRVGSDKLVRRYVDGLEAEYRLFDLQSRLTAAGLERLQRQTGDVQGAGGAGAVASDDSSIGAIPAVFSSPSFQLDDPRTFKQIIGTTAIVFDEHAGADYLASNTQLQEELLHYLDLVEIELVEEIARLLGSFFGTIDDIQRIGARSQECVTQLHALSAELAALEQSQSERGAHILDLVAKRHQVQQLEDGVLQVQHVVGRVERCQRLFGQAQYSECLAAIVDAERAAADVAALPALFDLQNDLHKLKATCTAEYTREFVDELVRDLQRHYRGIGAAEALRRMSTNGGGSYQRVDAATTALLRQRVRQLADSGALSAAYRSYQDRVVDEVKDIIKTNLPRRVADTDSDASRPGLVPPRDEASGSLSTSLRAMSRQEFLDMLVTTFTRLVECLRRLTTHQKLLLDLALTLLSADTTDVMTLDITVAISRAIEITQVRLCKVINVRLELIADLPVEDYLRVYALIQAYLRECELINPGFISTDSGKTLSDWARNHVGYFVHRLHLNALKALIYECDREVWKEVSDVATLRTVQRGVNELVTYAEYLDTEGRSGYLGDQWLQPMDVSWAAEATTEAEGLRAANLPVEGARIRVGLQQFLVPQLSIGVVAALRDYAVLSKAFGSRAATIGNDALNYCKLLNSRTSQAILGAGATRTAGLKHIFPKHMALCIQLVGFMIALLERASSIFGTPSKGDGDELTVSRLISNYKDHENELFGKLISMMYERTVNHCNTVKTIDWSVPVAPPHQCHPYMETLVKDTTTITKVLVKYLPPHQCHLILLQVFDNYKKLFVECYCTQIPQFKDFNEKHSLLKDIDFFRVKLGEVPGYGNSGQIIWENINSMPTIEDAKMEEIMRKNIERERGIEPARKSTDIIRRSLEAVRGKRAEAQPSSPEAAAAKPEQENQVNNEGDTERATPLSSEDDLATESVAARTKADPAPEHPNEVASNEMGEAPAPSELTADAATSLANSETDPLAAELGTPEGASAGSTVTSAEVASVGAVAQTVPDSHETADPEATQKEPTRVEATSDTEVASDAAAGTPENITEPEVGAANDATALNTTLEPIEESNLATAEADSEPQRVPIDTTTSPDKPAAGKSGKKKNKRKKKGKH